MRESSSLLTRPDDLKMIRGKLQLNSTVDELETEIEQLESVDKINFTLRVDVFCKAVTDFFNYYPLIKLINKKQAGLKNNGEKHDKSNRKKFNHSNPRSQR